MTTRRRTPQDALDTDLFCHNRRISERQRIARMTPAQYRAFVDQRNAQARRRRKEAARRRRDDARMFYGALRHRGLSDTHIHDATGIRWETIAKLRPTYRMHWNPRPSTVEKLYQLYLTSPTKRKRGRPFRDQPNRIADSRQERGPR